MELILQKFPSSPEKPGELRMCKQCVQGPPLIFQAPGNEASPRPASCYCIQKSGEGEFHHEWRQVKMQDSLQILHAWGRSWLDQNTPWKFGQYNSKVLFQKPPKWHFHDLNGIHWVSFICDKIEGDLIGYHSLLVPRLLWSSLLCLVEVGGFQQVRVITNW